MNNYTKEDIIRLVEEEDVEFIRLQFTDLFGNLKNIAVTASQLDRVLSNKCMFDGSAIDATNNWFNKNMSDIEIKLIASSQGNGFGETFSVNNATWNNITITQTVAPESVKVGNDEGKYHWISDKKNTILIRSNNTLKFTGLLSLKIGGSTYEKENKSCTETATDFYSGSCPYLSYLHFRVENGGVVEFRDTTIRSSYDTASWDGDNGAMLFYNTKMYDSWSSIGGVI